MSIHNRTCSIDMRDPCMHGTITDPTCQPYLNIVLLPNWPHLEKCVLRIQLTMQPQLRRRLVFVRRAEIGPSLGLVLLEGWFRAGFWFSDLICKCRHNAATVSVHLTATNRQVVELGHIRCAHSVDLILLRDFPFGHVEIGPTGWGRNTGESVPPPAADPSKIGRPAATSNLTSWR